jgi:hypothetical protein
MQQGGTSHHFEKSAPIKKARPSKKRTHQKSAPGVTSVT